MYKRIRSKRPFSVTLLALGVLCLTILNGIRLSMALTSWDLLCRIASLPSPVYVATTGLIWTIIGLLLYLGLWLGHYRIRYFILPITIFYATYYWLDRLLFQFAVQRLNWPFALAFTIVVIIFAIVVLTLPGNRDFFTQREEYDR